MLLLLAGCASTPEPRSVPTPTLDLPPPIQPWDGGGGAAGLRTRGEELADFALRLRGTPYRYGGAARGGFDCSGLVFFSHQQLGLVVPRTSRDQADGARQIKENKLRRGDLVFFKIGSRHVNHVGIYIGERNFVHAPGAGKPVTVNSLDDDYYAQRFSSAGRYWDRSDD
ncbi:MAG TPA: C40 family peptidase [Steroidobacteraceae bacterium]|nr:C40 family peptidase [Steroidobacteraceae bacterium]